MPDQWVVINWDHLQPRQRNILLKYTPNLSPQARSYMCGLTWKQIPDELRLELATVRWRETLIANHMWEDKYDEPNSNQGD
jgi:hypothetical protein